jgi:ribosomal protein S15P/S13E
MLTILFDFEKMRLREALPEFRRIVVCREMCELNRERIKYIKKGCPSIEDDVSVNVLTKRINTLVRHSKPHFAFSRWN